jgi:hypothetical protein
MGATRFHRDIALVSGNGTTNSAELTIRTDLRVEVTKLDGTGTDADTPASTRCVWIEVPSTTTFTLDFKLPKATTAQDPKSRYSYPSGNTTISGDLTHVDNWFRRFTVNNLDGKDITCTLNWVDTEGALSITVRPRASTGGAGGRSSKGGTADEKRRKNQYAR